MQLIPTDQKLNLRTKLWNIDGNIRCKYDYDDGDDDGDDDDDDDDDDKLQMSPIKR